MTIDNGQEKVRYPTGRLNLLQTMALLAIASFIVTVILRVFFT